MDITNLQGPLKKEVDMDTSMVSGGNSPGREEFDNFCKEFHKNAVFNGNLTMVMTLQMEENLIKYLLHPQETVSYSEMTHWLENFVFCVVSNDDENSCELHIWNDGQKRVISLENYYSLLTILYSEENFKTLEDFTKKINEQYALIPEGIIKYFFNLQTRKKSLFQPQNKENGHYRCKVTSYEYVKKTILKRRILTEVTNTLNGKVVASNCQEEDAVDEDLYSVEKTERVCEIINNEVNELSCMSYPSNQFLEVKYGGKKSLVLFPQNERQNQEHLLTLSSVLYSACATPQKTGEVQLEFAIPHKPPKRAVDIDVLGTFSNKNEKTLNVTLSEQKPKKKPVKELKGKLSIVSNPVTKGATLKCVENNSLNVSPLKHSYSELAAAASPSLITNIPGEVESIHNFMDGVANIFDDDNDHSPNINNEVCDEKRLCDDRTPSRSDKTTTIKMSTNISQAEPQSSINVTCNIVDSNHVTSTDSTSTQNVAGSDSNDSNNDNGSTPFCDTLSSTDAGHVIKKVNASDQAKYPKTKKIVDGDDDIASNQQKKSNNITSNQLKDSRKLIPSGGSIGRGQLELTDSGSGIVAKNLNGANKSTNKSAITESLNTPTKEETSENVSSSSKDNEITKNILGGPKGNSNKSKTELENSVVLENKNITSNLRRSNRRRKPTERILNDENNELKQHTDKSSVTPNPKNFKRENVDYINNSGEEAGMDDLHPSKETYKCRFCPKRYKSKSGCYYHENSHKVKDTSLCQFCGAAYPNKHCLRQHVRLKHSKNVHRKTEFPCPFDYCSRIFTSESGLRYHKMQHKSSSVGLVCETCGKELKNETTYKKHMLDVHGPKQESPTLYPCRECNKVFRQPGSRSYHMEAVHSGRNYTCDKCGDKLKTSLTLKYHMRRHQPDYKSKCTVCGKVYQSRAGLKTHMNVHLGLLPYSCDQCDKSFPSSVRRMNHVNRYHLAKRFLCEICDKSFSDRKSFKYHVLTHTGEKPHPCPDCGKSFRSRDLVYIHQKTHRGIKDFVCSHCGQEFSQKGNLMRHLKIIHNQ